MSIRLALLLLLPAPLLLPGIAFGADAFAPLPNFFEPVDGLHIAAPAQPRNPWTVAGEHAALFGRQNGKFEAWLWPNKILSNFSIRAEMADYPVPIDVNAIAAQIDVTPAETVITYSHPAFTIRQHMFGARGPAQASGAAAAVVFEIDSARALDIVFSFTPEMLRMWPAPSFGRPSGEWVDKGGNGLYILHTDNPQFSALVAMPHTKPGIMVPYQEHPQTFPLEFKLSFDPKRDSALVFPLVYAMTDGRNPQEQAQNLIGSLPRLYTTTRAYYRDFLAKHLAVDSPDAHLNEAAAWAEVAIDQTQVDYRGEIGMVAGYYESADSARPGYAWFFGRDTLWTTYAVNSYGDAALTRRALDFLLHRQRDDGKIMHEFSQSADAIDWKKTPYFYASADAPLLLIMAMNDYVSTAGDVPYVKQNWEAVKHAYEFTRSHASSDGIANNSQGTGWVESWPGGMPHQEIYMAALDAQASTAISKLAALVGDTALESQASQRARDIAAKIPAEYYDETQRFFAFSRNEDGSRDSTASIYPAVAWWDGTLSIPKADNMLSRWASDEFSTDWGTRDISNRTPFYDPISYHQGSIWPLFTGWTSLAEYRAGRPLSGYAHLMENANLTWAQDLGSVTELLSGDFYQPLGRSSSHQMWSSAMVLTPLVRGLFGVSWNAPKNTLKLDPHLPANWDHARLLRVPLGSATVDLSFQRQGDRWLVQGTGATNFCLQLASDRAPCSTRDERSHSLTFPAPPVELAVPVTVPDQGARTTELKVLNQTVSAQDATFVLSAPAGTEWNFPVRLNRRNTQVEHATLNGTRLSVRFPAGTGYRQETVRFHW